MSAGALELEFPVSCTLGEDCFIQNYFDRNPGPSVLDYACGTETYDGHKGTDFRLRTTADVAKGVAVVAAAPGVVTGRRDGVPDRLLRTDQDRRAVGDQECGNGVRIDHGEGLVTQYCHLRQGSVTVKKGQQVSVGEKLGEIGYSGAAAFPHLHLGVTVDGHVVDPFLTGAKSACGEQGPRASASLWSTSAKQMLAYVRGTVLAIGFADHAVTLKEFEVGTDITRPERDTPLVAYVWAINLQKGDLIEITLKRGEKMVAKNSETLRRDKAQFMLFVGKRPPASGWQPGTYDAEVKITRAGKHPASQQTKSIRFE